MREMYEVCDMCMAEPLRRRLSAPVNVGTDSEVAAVPRMSMLRRKQARRAQEEQRTRTTTQIEKSRGYQDVSDSDVMEKAMTRRNAKFASSGTLETANRRQRDRSKDLRTLGRRALVYRASTFAEIQIEWVPERNARQLKRARRLKNM